jgi:hypothetical protein
LRDETDEAEVAAPSAATSSPRARAPALAFVIGALVALCGGGLIVALVLSDTIITSRARDALVARGVVCDDRFALDVDWSLSEVTIAPTRCQLTELDFASAIELPEGATAHLSALSATDLSVPSARAFLIDAPSADVDLGGLGPLGSLGLGGLADVGSHVAATARAASELAAHEPIPTGVGRLELVHRDVVVVTFETLEIGGAQPTTLRAARVSLATMTGPMGMALEGSIETLTGSATPSTCHLEGDLSVGARLPVLGAFGTGVHVILEGAALDTDAPTFSVTGS